MQSYVEAGGRDLLQLVVRRLTGRGHAEVGEGARHKQVSFEKDGRNSSPVQKTAQLFFEQVARGCPKTIGFGRSKTG